MQHLLCGRLLFGSSAEPGPFPSSSVVRASRSAALALQLASEPQTLCNALRQWSLPLRAALRHERLGMQVARVPKLIQKLLHTGLHKYIYIYIFVF